MSNRFVMPSLLLVAAACQSPPPSEPDLGPAANVAAAGVLVHPGQSIQAAIDAAASVTSSGLRRGLTARPSRSTSRSGSSGLAAMADRVS